jgi:hypothetical protein
MDFGSPDRGEAREASTPISIYTNVYLEVTDANKAKLCRLKLRPGDNIRESRTWTWYTK